MVNDSTKERSEKNRVNAVPAIHWDDSSMRTSYANACNVVSTREEIVLFFGINQGQRGGEEKLTIELGDRVILSPHAAKRFHLMLTKVIQEHESRFGVISFEINRADISGKQPSGDNNKVPTPTKS